MSERMRKVNEALRHVLADGVESLADPGLGFVTITAVRASPDLGHAEVYVSVLGSQKRRSVEPAGPRSGPRSAPGPCCKGASPEAHSAAFLPL